MSLPSAAEAPSESIHSRSPAMARATKAMSSTLVSVTRFLPLRGAVVGEASGAVALLSSALLPALYFSKYLPFKYDASSTVAYGTPSRNTLSKSI